MLYFAMKQVLNEYGQVESIRVGSAKKSETGAANVLRNKHVDGYVVNERNFATCTVENGEVRHVQF